MRAIDGVSSTPFNQTGLMQHITIVGAGFSALAISAQLLQQSAPVKLQLIAPQHSWYGGTAYRLGARQHLLNVVAGNMSIDPSAPDDFVNFLPTTPAAQQQFARRADYGRYLQTVAARCEIFARQHGHQFALIDDTITAVDLAKQTLTGTSDRSYHYDQVVFASGVQAPQVPLSHPRLIANPWHLAEPKLRKLARQHIAQRQQPILLVGSSLTMVDTYMALREFGFQQPIISLSRHGYRLLPHRFLQLKDAEQFAAELLALPNLRQQTRYFHERLRTVWQQGLSSEALANALRPYLSQLWQRLTTAEQKQFLRHLASRWNIARHRLPDSIFTAIESAANSGELRYERGHLQAIRPLSDQQLTVEYRERGSGELVSQAASLVVMCTGPSRAFAADHYLAGAIARGELALDKTELGLAADANTFAVLNAAGVAHHNVYAVGQLVRGVFWECTSVPDLRYHCYKIAQQLLKQSIS